VAKLSFESGLLYSYYRDEAPTVSQWWLTGIDVESGETVWKARIGAGQGFNNWAGALFLHPRGGIAYSTTIFGLVAIHDAPVAAVGVD
jgi:hypothetical protein